MQELVRALSAAQAIADPGQRARALGALASQHDVATAWWNLAETLLELERRDEARAALLRALALDRSLRAKVTPRLAALVEVPAEAPQAQEVALRPVPASVAAPAAPPRRVEAQTLVDPVESLLGATLQGDLRIDVLLHRSSSQALYRASRPSGQWMVRQLLGMAPQAAQRALMREQQAPQVAGCARVVDVIADRHGTPLALLPPVRGELLADRLRAGPLAPPSTIALVRGVAQILEELRQHGASVGDVHPEIVFFDEASETVTLLGAARTAARWGGGTLVASPARLLWAAPEEGLADGGATSIEVYHLGLLLLACMVGGEVPDLPGRIGGEWPAWLERALAGRPTSWSALRGTATVDSILRRCLSPRSSERLATPAELSRALGATVGQFSGELRGRAGTLFDPAAEQRALIESQSRRAAAAVPSGAGSAGAARLWAMVLGGAVLLGVVIGGLIQLLRG